MAFRSPCARGRPSASSANPARARRRSVSRSCRLIRSEGPIVYCGRQIDGLNSKAMRPLRREMQIVFQDPYGSLSPAHVGGRDRRGRADRAGDEAQRRRAPRASPSGRSPTPASIPRRSTAIRTSSPAASASASPSPARWRSIREFVVLDEPTSALDMSIQAQIVDLLRDLQRRRNLAYLFISHDLKVVRALASEIIVMRRGKVVESGEARSGVPPRRRTTTRARFVRRRLRQRGDARRNVVRRVSAAAKFHSS